MNQNIFPCLTLYQPWATWIMRGWKTIETRTHNRFKSLNDKIILIHAGMKTDNSDYAIKNPYLTQSQILENPDEMVNGFILGSVHVNKSQPLYPSHSKDALINCQFTLDGKYISRHGLFLDSVKVFDKPIPVKGEMGIWYFDLDKMEKVKSPKIKRDAVSQTNLFQP